jgi:hypothetical protein
MKCPQCAGTINVIAGEQPSCQLCGWKSEPAPDNVKQAGTYSNAFSGLARQGLWKNVPGINAGRP